MTTDEAREYLLFAAFFLLRVDWQLSPLFVHTPFVSNISRHHTHESCLHWYNWSSLVHLDSWHLDSSDSRMSLSLSAKFRKKSPKKDERSRSKWSPWSWSRPFGRSLSTVIPLSTCLPLWDSITLSVTACVEHVDMLNDLTKDSDSKWVTGFK